MEHRSGMGWMGKRGQGKHLGAIAIAPVKGLVGWVTVWW